MDAKLKTAEARSLVARPTATLGDRHLRYACYAAVVAVLILFAVIRFRLRTMPLERDEGEYAYSGQLMLEGIPPYKLAFNMKLPGTYAAYAVIMAVFGRTVTGIRLGMLFVNAATTLLVFLLGRRLFGILGGTVAAMTYALLSNRTSMLSLDGHATHFVALSAVGATLLLLRALDTRRTTDLFFSGLLYGLSFLMKQPGILFAVFGLFYLIWTTWKQPAEHRILSKEILVLTAGVILPFVCICVFLAEAGAFREFWFWTFSYSRQYGSQVSLPAGWELFRRILPWIVRPFVIWGMAAFGLVSNLWNSQARKHGVFLTAFLIFSFLAVCPGLYFRGHYFLVMLPAVALLAGVGIAVAHENLLRYGGVIAALPSLFFVLTFLTALYGHRAFLFNLSPVEVSERMHPGDGCAEARVVAAFVQQHSAPNDSIAVLGSEPEIYFYGRRHSASGYIYMYPLMERQKFARQMQSEMIRQIEEARPRMVVFADNELSWGWSTPGAEKREMFDWMHGYLDANYALAESVPFQGNAQHQWGDQPSYYVFQRKER